MLGIACIFISCCLFIHLGLGEAINKTMRIRFVLFRCVKCLTFWVITGYSLLFTSLPIEVSLCIGFICAYMALWSDILLGYLANIYEKLSKSLESKEPARHSANGRTKGDKKHQEQKGKVQGL